MDTTRTRGGTLKIGSKSYPVYEGINTVGRNRGALINIKSLNVSQNHAAIVIFNENQHYISDINSSNGTILNEIKLVPYKLYELTDHVEIKIGGIQALYFKNTTASITTSMETTQNYTDSFYVSNTQLMEATMTHTRTQSQINCILPEPETQPADYPLNANQSETFKKPATVNQQTGNDREIESAPYDDYHEAPTQDVGSLEPTKQKCYSLPGMRTTDEIICINNYHSAPTQIMSSQDVCDDKSDGATAVATNNETVDLTGETETIVINSETIPLRSDLPAKEPGQDDVDKNENLINNNNCTLQKQNEVETILETVPSTLELDLPVDKNTNPVNAHKSESQTTEILSEKSSQTTIGSQSVRSSIIGAVICDETFENTSSANVLEEIIEESITYDDIDNNSNDSIDLLKMDMEENDDSNIFNNESRSNAQGLPVEEPKENLCENNLKEASNSDTEIEETQEIFSYKKKKVRTLKSDSESDVESTQEIGHKKPVRQLDSDSETDCEEINENDQINKKSDYITSIPSTQEVEACNLSKYKSNLEENEEIVTKIPNKTLPENMEKTLDDSECIPATQDVFAETFGYRSIEKPPTSSEESFKLGLTELMQDTQEKFTQNNKEATSQKTDKEIISGKEQDNKTDETNKNKEIITENLQSKLDDKHSSVNTYKSLISTQRFNEEMYDIATQRLTQNEVPSTSKTIESQADEDIYLMPTQPLNTCPDTDSQFKVPKKYSFKKKNLIFDKSLNSLLGCSKVIEDDEELDAPTQKLAEDDNTTQKLNEETIEDDVFLQPTQCINILAHNPLETGRNNDEVFEMETQAIGLEELEISTDVVSKIIQKPNSANENVESQLEVNFSDKSTKISPKIRSENPLARILDKPVNETSKDVLVVSIVPMTESAKTENVSATFKFPKSKSVKTDSSIKMVEDDVETLSQIDNFIKETSSKDKPAHETVSQIEESVQGIPQKPPSRSLRKRQIEDNSVKKTTRSTKVKKIEQPSLIEEGLESTDEELTKSLSEDKRDINETFMALVSKTSKVRKKSTTADLEEIKVFATSKRESMCIMDISSKKSKKMTENNKATKRKSKSEASAKAKTDKVKDNKKDTKIGSAVPQKRTRRSSSSDFAGTTTEVNKLTAIEKMPSSSKDVEKQQGTPKRTRHRSAVLNSPNLGTPERLKRKTKPKVVFTMMDNHKTLLELQICNLGGSVVETVEESTVLVTESVKRSLKLLQAIGLARPICSPEWLKASKKSNEFLDPWDFILIDKAAESKWNFSLKESLRRAATTNILKDYTFQILTTTAVDVLKGAIEASGGKCVTRNPGKNRKGQFVVIANENQMEKYSKIIKQYPGTIVIKPEAIFDGVLRQELKFEDHLLS